MILARQMTVPSYSDKNPRLGDPALLKKVDLVILPVFSVDAHEKMNPFNRPNQNGPKEMGWRTTAQNLNLNRDYAKVDAGEMRAMLPFMVKLSPDFFIDNHTTDGGDWQYTVQYDVPRYPTMDKAIVDWSVEYQNAVMPMVDKAGFLTAPYFGGISQTAEHPTIRADYFGPRYSTGYMVLRNVPSLLVETHVLKAYKPRVEGTMVVDYRTWEWCGDHAASLLAARKKADGDATALKAGDSFPLGARTGRDSVPWTFKGYEYAPYKGSAAGGEIPGWTTKKVEKDGQYFSSYDPTLETVLPTGYLVPQEWTDVLAVLRAHGIEMERVGSDGKGEAEVTHFSKVTFATSPFEGRFTPKYEMEVKKETADWHKGDYFVPVGQKLGRLVVHLLEPKAVDSLLNWGFWNATFEEKEYAESYAMEKIAEKMLRDDPKLKAEFEAKLASEPDFAASLGARLRWFYERSPYFDKDLNRYPVLRLGFDPNDR